MVTPAQKQQSIAYQAEAHKASRARACRLVNQSRTQAYYEKKMPAKDAEVKQLIAAVTTQGRKGRNQVIAQIKRKHPALSASKIRRVYQKEGFSLYHRLKKRRLSHPVLPHEIPLVANTEWAMDFMSDSLRHGQRFRTFNVIDPTTRQCLWLHIAQNLPATRVIAQLKMLVQTHGKPQRIRTDNGPEFTSKQFQLWLKDNHIQWAAIEKGKPQQNPIIERFNRTFREEVLDANLFTNIGHAQQMAEDWQQYYNHERPHMALQNKTPMEYAA